MERQFIGIELNPDYAMMIRRKLVGISTDIDSNPKYVKGSGLGLADDVMKIKQIE